MGKEIRKNLSIRQYSSANCCNETALVWALSCTSYLTLVWILQLEEQNLYKFDNFRHGNASILRQCSSENSHELLFI